MIIVDVQDPAVGHHDLRREQVVRWMTVKMGGLSFSVYRLQDLLRADPAGSATGTPEQGRSAGDRPCGSSQHPAEEAWEER